MSQVRRRTALPLIVVLAIGAFLVGCSSSQSPTSTASPSTAASSSGQPTLLPSASPSRSSSPIATLAPGRLLGLHLPTKVSALVARFGWPDHVRVPTQAQLDTSPEGQWFRWDNNSSGSTLSALGDEYSKTPNYHANVRFVQLMATGAQGHRKTLFGFVLNKTTRGAALRALHGSVVPAVGRYKSLHKDVLIYKRHGMYTFLFFGPGQRLNGVAQATFNMDGAGG